MAESSICMPSVISTVPALIQVIPAGRHMTAKGEFLLDARAAGLVLKSFDERENQMVIDYEHQSLTGGVAPAAGWIRRLMDRGEQGLWAEVEWTPRARQYLGGCEYRYLSPVFLIDEISGRVVKLVNAALTNTPAIDGMVPVTGLQEALPERTEKGEDAGKAEKDELLSIKRKEELMQKILDALGLEGSTGEEGILAAISVMREELDVLGESLKRVGSALGLEPSVEGSELEGTVLAMRHAADEAETLRLRLENQEAHGLVAMAMKEGKVSPAQREWAMSYALRDAGSFRVFAAKAPVVVPLVEMGNGLDVGTKAKVCPVQEDVNRALGLSQEKFVKYTPKEEK